MRELVFYTKQGPGFPRESIMERFLRLREKLRAAEDPAREQELRELLTAAAGAVLVSAAGRLVSMSDTLYLLDEADWCAVRQLLDLGQRIAEPVTL